MVKRKKPELTRCSWASEGEWGEFHDNIFGKETHDSRQMFETLCLCSQSAGLNWRVVWGKKEAYDEAFHGWEIGKVAKMAASEIDDLVENPEAVVIRNRRKLEAIVANAKLIQKLDQSFADYIWGMVNHSPVVNHRKWPKGDPPPMVSKTSIRIARMLKKKGFKHVGPKTVQTFCVMTGLINDHCITCHLNPNNKHHSSRKKKTKH